MKESDSIYARIAIILVLLMLVISMYRTYYIESRKYTNEKFAPYASILSPFIVNSTAGFDFPNQYGDTTDPYEYQKKESAKLFKY